MNLHQPLSTLINPYQPSSTLINLYQPLSTLILILNPLPATMHTRFILSFAFALLLFACKQDATNNTAAVHESANLNNLGGQWIALDFCSRAAQYGSVLQAEYNAHRPYAFALVFNPAQPDSVLCFDGVKNWKLPIKITQDTIEMQGAAQGRSIFLMYDSQSKKHLTMFDGASSNKTQTDRFLKSTVVDSRNGYEAFTRALYHHLFQGSFSLLAAKSASSKIVFLPEGVIQGWPDYDRYSVCTGGECLVMGNELDIMTLRNSKKEGAEKMFGFKYSNQNDTLSISNLADATPNEKGGYAVKGVAYRFLRKLPNK